MYIDMYCVYTLPSYKMHICGAGGKSGFAVETLCTPLLCSKQHNKVRTNQVGLQYRYYWGTFRKPSQINYASYLPPPPASFEPLAPSRCRRGVAEGRTQLCEKRVILSVRVSLAVTAPHLLLWRLLSACFFFLALSFFSLSPPIFLTHDNNLRATTTTCASSGRTVVYTYAAYIQRRRRRRRHNARTSRAHEHT